jgi:hypothetical protein
VTDPSTATHDPASQAHDALRRTTREVQGSVRERVRNEVDTRTTTAGEQMGALSRAMHDVGGELRSQGNDLPARLADEVADRAERLGGYLRESDAERIIGDVEDFGRRQPWVMAVAGVVIGVAAARLLKASSQRRHERRRGGPAPLRAAG